MRYSTETLDLFAGVELDRPRYVPKAGGQWDLIDSAPMQGARSPETSEEEEGEEEGGATPPPAPARLVEPLRAYFFGTTDADGLRTWGESVELDRWAEWPEPGPMPDPWDALALARWVVIVAKRREWAWERRSRWLTPWPNAYGLKTRHMRRLAQHLTPSITLAPAYRLAHPSAAPHVLDDMIDGARAVLSHQELPPRGRMFSGDKDRIASRERGAAEAWKWAQRSTHPAAIAIVNAVARAEVDLLMAGEIHAFHGYHGGYSAVEEPRRAAEEWGRAGGKSPLWPAVADPAAYAIARFDRDDHRGMARRLALAQHLARAKDAARPIDERREMVRRFLAAHGSQSQWRAAATSSRYWRAPSLRIFWGVTDYMAEPVKWKALRVEWGERSDRLSGKLKTADIIDRWAGYRGINLVFPDKRSLFT